MANQVLLAPGASVDETQNDFYDETAVMKVAERFSIWVEYEGRIKIQFRKVLESLMYLYRFHS